MRRVIGQAAGRAALLLHRLLHAAQLLALLAVVGLAALAWRLDQGPLVLPRLAEELAAQANRHIAPLRLEIGEAALVWQGFRHGADRPLEIRASDLAVYAVDGRRVALVPQVNLSLSLRALAGGRIAPRSLLVQGASVRALRREDGSLAVDFSGGGSPEPTAGAPPGRPADFAWLLRALAQPPGEVAEGQAGLLSQVRRLRLRDIDVVVQDQALGLRWRAHKLELDLTRQGEGGVEGTAALELAAGGQVLPVSGRLSLPAAGRKRDAALDVAATLDSVVPADFAALAPAFAPLAAVQAPVTLTATAELGADLVPRHGRLLARMAAGRLHIARGSIPVSGGRAVIEGTREEMRLDLQRLELPGPADGSPTIVTGTASLRPQAGMLAATLDLRLDQVGFAHLATLWPDGVGGPGAKPWITGNITAGTAHDLRLHLRLVAAADLSDGAVTALTGTVAAQDMVVHWLRPVPPAEGVAARLDFVSADEIEVTLLGGAQGALVLSGGRVTLTGLARRDQYATVSVDMAGPVTELIGVLNHPRVNLLSRRPIPMRNPAGQVEGRLVVLALPLENDLTLEDVRLSAVGRLSGLALGGIAAGRDLTGGELSFEAGNDGLRMRGTAALAGIATQLAVEMDFTDGPPAQVIQTVTLAGTAEAAQLVALGLDTPELALTGSAALKLDLVGRRSGRTEIAVRADLARLALRADRLNWAKPAGRPALAEAQLVLERERLASVDKIRIEGEGVSVQAALAIPRSAPRRLVLSRAVLAPGSDVQGEIVWPRGEGQPWTVRLSGAGLDISGEMARKKAPGEAVRGPPWNAELRVERLVLGAGRFLSAVQARSDNDGLVTRNARVTGRAGGGAFELSILPSGLPRQRSLTITARDAGALLAALDVMDDMRGGVMRLTASYDDARPGHPLSGTAEVADFGMRNAPAIGKLLQAITVVGAVEAFSGPDLRFTRLVAPFRFAGEVVELHDARAFSASLGVTAKGRMDLARRRFDLRGTVVPAYFLNSLLGRVPVLGKLLSPETGGGLFAMSFAVTGPFDDPSVSVNPLSAVTPGFLRGLFGALDGGPGGGGDGRPATRPAAPVNESGQR